MTTISVVVSSQDDTVITCPNCRRSKHTQLSKFKNLQRPLKVKCACGSSFGVNLNQEDGINDFLVGSHDVSGHREPIPPPPYAVSNTGHTPAEDDQIRHPFFHGEAVPLFGMDIAKRFLGYITGGLYNFWGRTKIRTYIVNHTEFEGERFVFHGTGKELMLGWLKAILICGLVGFGLPLGLALFFSTVIGSETLAGAVIITSILILNQLIIPIVMVNVRRYRLSHTSWHGIRFAFRGSVFDFIKIYLKGALLTMLTFGIYYPIFATQRYAFMTRNSYYGNQPFHFDGEGRELMGSFLRTYLPSLLIPVLYWRLFGGSFFSGVLTLVTLGFFWMHFFAEKQRYFWDHTSFAAARFRCAITDWDFMMLRVVNVLLMVVTLSFGWAWTKVRAINFLFRHITLEGPLELERIQSADDMTSPTSEGVASFLEMEFDIG